MTIFKSLKIRFYLFFCLAIGITNMPNFAYAQLDDECKLDIGTNLGGLADFGTELPFVDLMKNARTWYTKDIGNPNAPFDSEHAEHLSYRPDGYPTHIPQNIPESSFPQKAVTIWAITDGWPAGQYTVLWEGTGNLEFIGSHQNLMQTDSHRIVFDFPNPIGSLLEMTIAQSDINDPIHNIRVLMPGSEASYQSQIFNPIFLDKALSFKTVRFMDWGQTNNWGQTDEQWNDPNLFDWSDRSQLDHYTWAYEKGIPYEIMVKIMNDYDLDGWVCVPHKASDDYLSNMANYFRDNLEPERHLTVEYSNEIWNWLFGQTHWLNEYGCVQQGVAWPEGIAPYVQNCLDHFSTAYDGQLHRITRIVGAFTGWPDITQTIVDQLTPGSFDAISPTFYFGIPETGDLVLDSLGSNATVADIAHFARQGIQENFMYIQMTKNDIADPLGLPLKFYEGGQHLTPHPFGAPPSYAQALIDIQRDTTMYNLYNEWFDSLRTLQSGDDPLLLMHFSFVSQRSAQYGSWGMLETMDQDTNSIPAPKYSAILANQAEETCQSLLSVDLEDYFVKEEACTAHIFWETTNEKSNSHFLIERRHENQGFQPITKIDGAGYSNSRKTYHYADPLLTTGKYYYRIIQVDFDGTQKNLGIRTLDLNCGEGSNVKIFPNPAEDYVMVQSETLKNMDHYLLLDTRGKVLRQSIIPASAQETVLKIDIEDLPAGIYYFQLRGNHQITKGHRLVKMK